MNFSKNIKSKIEEFFEDLQMELQYSYANNFQTGDTTDYRYWYSFGIKSISFGLAIFAAINWWNPVGWVSGVIAGVTIVADLLSSWFFKSKEERIKEAKEKVIKGILPQIQKQENEIKQTVKDTFLKNIAEVQGNLNKKLDYIIKGLTDIKSILKDIESESSIIQSSLNKVFVFRILEHLGKMKINVKDNTLMQYINRNLETTQIDRNYKRSYLNIKTDFNISSKEEKEIKEIIQTNVNFIK